MAKFFGFSRHNDPEKRPEFTTEQLERFEKLKQAAAERRNNLGQEPPAELMEAFERWIRAQPRGKSYEIEREEGLKFLRQKAIEISDDG